MTAEQQNYWRERALYAKRKQLREQGRYEMALRARLQDLENECVRQFYKDLAGYAQAKGLNIPDTEKYLKTIDINHWSMTLAEFEAKAKAGGYEAELNAEYYKSLIARLQRLYEQLQELAKPYANDEQNQMALELAGTYKQTYDLDQYTQYQVAGGLAIDMAHFNEAQLKAIVYKPWRGSNFSKRIWKNYTKILPDALADTLARGTLMGSSSYELEQMMRLKVKDIADTDLHRLVVTEMGHAQEEATAQFYDDSDIEQYQYLATLESHTCDVCASLDEKVFNVKDKEEGVNYPLIHPYCRCSTCPYEKDLPGASSRWYRDPITGQGEWTSDMSYDQWAKAMGIDRKLSKRKFLSTSANSYEVKKLASLPLTNKERWAMNNYISPFSIALNDSLRKKIPLTRTQAATVKNLDAALEKMPTYAGEQPLNRSLLFRSDQEVVDYINKALVQGYIQEPSYTSTSKGMIYNPSDNLRVIIRKSYSGKDISKFNEEESEVLFKRNTRFDTLGVKDVNGKPYLEVVEHEEKE